LLRKIKGLCIKIEEERKKKNKKKRNKKRDRKERKNRQHQTRHPLLTCIARGLRGHRDDLNASP
jgi:hypothetical protein